MYSVYSFIPWIASICPVGATAKQSSQEREAKTTCLWKKCLYIQVHSSIIHNSQNKQAAQVSVDE